MYRRTTLVQNATHWNPEEVNLLQSNYYKLRLAIICFALSIVVVFVTGGGGFLYNRHHQRIVFRCGIYSQVNGGSETEFVFAPRYMELVSHASIDLSNLKLIGEVILRVSSNLNVYFGGEKVTDEEVLQVWRERMLDYAESIQVGDDAVLKKFQLNLVYAATEPALPVEENN